jgi:very-short-patch-repair endonuclease
VEAVTAVHECGGAARWDRLRHLTTQRALQAAVDAGGLGRPRRGLYVVPDCPPDVVAAAAVRGVRSCHSAAAALGLPLVDPPREPHVTAGPGTRLSWGGAVVHRRRVVDLDGLTDPLTTVVDCLRCLPPRLSLVPVDAAVAEGLVSLEDLALAAKRLNRKETCVATLLRWSDGRSGSPLESVARYDFLSVGLAPEVQVHVPGVGWVDFLLDGWLVVEVDGRRYHSHDPEFAADRRRDAELTRRGYVVLRFTWDEVVHHPERWLAVVQDLLASRALRTGPRAPM